MNKRNYLIHGDFGIIFWIHLSLILFFWLSPFLVGWKLVILCAGMFYLTRVTILKKCPLSDIQFQKESPNTYFQHYYLTKMGFKFSKEGVRKVTIWFLPWFLIAFSLIWQILLGKKPLLL